jgi:formyltetrahydrofolate hydrolase
MNRIKHLDELLDAIFLSHLQSHTESIYNDSDERLVHLLKLYSHLFDRLCQQLNFYWRTVLRSNKLLHNTVKKTEFFHCISGDYSIVVESSQLLKNKIVFLLITQEKHCNQVLLR